MYQTRGTLAKIVVIRGHITSAPLISKGTLMEPGMLEIQDDGSYGKPSNVKILDEMLSINIVTGSVETNNEHDSMCMDKSRATNDNDEKTTSCSTMNTASIANHVKTSSKVMPSG